MEKQLVIITVQYGYLKKITDQLKTVFGDLINYRSVQLNSLSKEPISETETVFSAIPGIKQLVKRFYPEVTKFIQFKRSINLVNTRELLNFTDKKRILVVSDQRFSTRHVIDELRENGFDHEYIPFTPGKSVPDNIDCVVSPSDIHLVPEISAPLINIGVNVTSLETIVEIKDHFNLNIDHITLSKKFIQSLLVMSHFWPVSKRNKFVSSWIGTSKDHKLDINFSDFVLKSDVMRDFVIIAKSMSKTNNPIHISGEDGVGKRSVAIAIHNESPFKEGAFKHINCLNRNATVLNKELFGDMENQIYHAGLFETITNGTLCLEEIDSAPIELLEKIAQLLKHGNTISENGREIVIGDNLRVITTSNRKITELFQQRKIHKDLYYTLSLFACHMPSLEERSEDFFDLVKNYLCKEIQRPDLIISDEVIGILKNHKWEGNVQELYNVLSFLVSINEKKITVSMLPFYIPRIVNGQVSTEDNNVDVESLIAEIEKKDFLNEILIILKLYHQGKEQNKFHGRGYILKQLKKDDIYLSQQQLRLKLERLDKLGLLTVRLGRVGTTISKKGEAFLNNIKNKEIS